MAKHQRDINVTQVPGWSRAFMAAQNTRDQALVRLAKGIVELRDAMYRPTTLPSELGGSIDEANKMLACAGIGGFRLPVNEGPVGDWCSAKQEYERIITQLRVMGTTLDNLAKVFFGAIPNVVTAMNAAKRSHWIDLLPDEILAQILEMVQSNRPVGLSNVCRRFRRIALDSPRLWRVVSSEQKIEYLSMNLERSKEVGLDVSFIDYPECHTPEILPILFAHTRRWKWLNMEITIQRVAFPTDATLHFPLLHTLELRYTGNLTDEENAPLLENSLAKFDMPALRCLTLQNILPLFASNPFLRQFSLSVDCLCESDSDFHDREIQYLNTFLGSSPGLEYLELNFAELDFLTENGGRQPKIQLRKLRTFKLRVCQRGSEMDKEIGFCEYLSKSLYTPALVRLHIILESFNEDISPVLGSILSGRRKDTRLKKLDLTISSYNAVEHEPFTNMFDQVPHVEHIIVDCDGGRLSIPNSWQRKTKLCTLSLCGYDPYLNGEFQSDIVELLVDKRTGELNSAFPLIRKVVFVDTGGMDLLEWSKRKGLFVYADEARRSSWVTYEPIEGW